MSLETFSGRQDHQVTPFGDIVVIARGQLYFSHSGFFFVQDPYQNDCDECHNPNPTCTGGQCQTWRPPNDEKLIALWTVKKIRHRESNGGFRHELKYIISPMGNRSNKVLLRRDGRFDYNIPGHVFILRSGLNGHRLQENLRESHRIYSEDEKPTNPIFRPSLPAAPNYIHEYLPTNVQYPPQPEGQRPLTERTKPSTPYGTLKISNQIDETPSAKETFPDRHVSNQITNKPKTEEGLYRELINILQQKASAHSSLQNKDHHEKHFNNENRFPPGAILDKPPSFSMSYEIGLRNHHTTSPTYATHIKKMQSTISNPLSQSKEATPLLILPTISREYSKTTMYSSTNAKDNDFALSTAQTLFSNPPPTPYSTVTSGTTSLPKPHSTTSENKKPKSQMKLSARLGPLGNYRSISSKTSTKNRFSSSYTTKMRTTPSTTTISKISKYGIETAGKVQPYSTKLQTTPSSKSSPEFEIIPITDQNTLLTPILDLLRPIMEIMKTENPFTHYYETSTVKTFTPPSASTLTETNKQHTTTSLPKENKAVTTSSEKNNQRATVVEIQKSETKSETVEEISPEINKSLVNAKTTNIPTKQTYTSFNKETSETTTFSLNGTTTETREETTTETSATSKITRFSTKTIPFQTVSTIVLSKETIVELNMTDENSSLTASQNIPTAIPKPKTKPLIVRTTTKLPLLINKTNPSINIPKKTSQNNQNTNFVNDIFGTTKHITTTKKTPSSIEKLEESNVSILEELFGPSHKTATTSVSASSKINDRMDYDITSTKTEETEETEDAVDSEKTTEVKSTPKIIFSNFFFAPTKTPENVTVNEEQETQLKAVIKKPNTDKSTLNIEKMKMMAHYTMNEDQEEIPTSQSVSTSISYIITKPNRTKITSKPGKYESGTMVKALVKEITNKHNDFIVFEAEFPNNNKAKTENDIETSVPDIKSFLNNITLSVVNHARAIDYVQAEKNDSNSINIMKNKSKLQPPPKQRTRKGVITKTV
ncbi:flocculation protein FLO11-like [Agrilus planipennis]|uniref:Flocculation protein FLO11-like n=1 Tax=Agrilus planipennis TaxID=224129 RepID=A0A1W4W7I0_AGRPL|nr:flocculation protein FLO11-like [Agrilus planipennis]